MPVMLRTTKVLSAESPHFRDDSSDWQPLIVALGQLRNRHNMHAADRDFSVLSNHSGRCGAHRKDLRNCAVNVLLLSMPDSFEHMPTVAVRMPNGGLTSLAGNVDPHHQGRRRRPDPRTAEASARPSSGSMREHDPDVVGLSVMTFQRKTAFRVIELVRALEARVRKS